MTDVPHPLVADAGPAVPYVLVTAPRGTVVFAVSREDVR